MLHAPTKRHDATILLPSQSRTYAKLKSATEANPYVVFTGAPGMGRTVLLKRLAAETGARYIGVHDVAEKLSRVDRLKVSEAIYELVSEALEEHGAVVIDDFFAIVRMEAKRGLWGRGASGGLVVALRDIPVKRDQRLVVGGNIIDTWQSASDLYGESVVLVASQSFDKDDYRTYLTRALGEAVAAVDFRVIFRAAPALDIFQLEMLGNLLRGRGALTTQDLVACLEADILSSNIRLEEVETLTFDRLPGSEAIAETLENHLVLPFQNPQFAEDLGISPRRGVLLYGPPGTGKTSIGRALAHRMQGRFFLVDGTFVTEPPSDFFARIEAVVSEAKANAPSVLFIDDADVLFQIEHIAGLSRYLLSLLDGLESERSKNVCVVLTAMDAMKIPEALLRSGRIELWLETKAPDAAARASIIERWLPADMAELGEVDHARVARETEGFTPADLRRLAGDAKLLYAADIVRERPPTTSTDYLLRAVDELVATRAIMAQRLADDALLIRPYV